jgi:hypothetical protein
MTDGPSVGLRSIRSLILTLPTKQCAGRVPLSDPILSRVTSRCGRPSSARRVLGSVKGGFIASSGRHVKPKSQEAVLQNCETMGFLA